MLFAVTARNCYLLGVFTNVDRAIEVATTHHYGGESCSSNVYDTRVLCVKDGQDIEEKENRLVLLYPGLWNETDEQINRKESLLYIEEEERVVYITQDEDDSFFTLFNEKDEAFSRPNTSGIWCYTLNTEIPEDSLDAMDEWCVYSKSEERDEIESRIDSAFLFNAKKAKELATPLEERNPFEDQQKYVLSPEDKGLRTKYFINNLRKEIGVNYLYFPRDKMEIETYFQEKYPEIYGRILLCSEDDKTVILDLAYNLLSLNNCV